MRVPGTSLRVAMTLAATIACTTADAQFGIPNLGNLIQRGGRQQQYSAPPPQQQQPVRQVTQLPVTDKSDWDDGIRRYAVIVGVGEYVDSGICSLPGVAQVASKMKTTLVKGGFREDDVTLLTSGETLTSGTKQPRLQSINAQIDSVLNKAGERDIVVVMLIGHGVSVDGISYFCPSDTDQRAPTNAAVAAHSAISIPELARRMASRKIGQKMLVVDACRDTANGVAAGFEDLPKDLGDVWVINSCSDGEQAWVTTPDTGDSIAPLFSHYLCESLTGKGDLYGDLDGRVTIREAHKYALRRTQETAARKMLQQTPKIFPTMGTFEIVKVSNVLTGRSLITGDAELEQRQSAHMLANKAAPVFFEDHEAFNREVIRQITQQNRISPDLFRDHHNLMCYVFGNYLSPALDLDADCADAHLVRGFCYRASGEYSAALSEYTSAKVPLEVFASGRIGSKDQVFSVDRNGNQLFDENLSNDQLRQLIESVPLRRTPGHTSPVVGSVQAASNLIVSDVKTVNSSESGIDQWLLISKIDDKPLPVPGWIHESSVHWFKEAGQMYLASSEINANLPSIVQGQQRAAGVARKISEVRHSREEIEKAKRILAIAQRFGAPIPGYVFQILNGVQTILGAVEQGKMLEHAQLYEKYHTAAENAPRIIAERIRLLRSEEIAPIETRPVTIEASPWSLLASADVLETVVD